MNSTPRKKNQSAKKMVEYAEAKKYPFEVHASTHISFAWKEFYEEVGEVESERVYPMVSAPLLI